MSDQPWDEFTYKIPASHVRGFSGGLKKGSSRQLRISVKQYVTKKRQADVEDAITLIAAPGIGQAKELFEPFFKHLVNTFTIPIRSIWSFDPAHVGHSYVLNEDIIGDKHHWLDGSRDLLQLVNYFQNDMPPPIYGLGQSWGSALMLMTSAYHTRLFAGLLFSEPIFATGYRFRSYAHPDAMEDRQHGAVTISKRADTWSSREEAREHLKTVTGYKDLDPEVFELSMVHDLRDVPNLEQPCTVKFTTPTSMILATMLLLVSPDPGNDQSSEAQFKYTTIVVPGFYRPEVALVQRALPMLYPPVLYLWGERSSIGMSDYALSQVGRTGIDSRGGGTDASGQVTSTLIPGAGHSLLLEKPMDAAFVIAPWIRHQYEVWRQCQKVQNKQANSRPHEVDPAILDKLAKL